MCDVRLAACATKRVNGPLYVRCPRLACGAHEAYRASTHIPGAHTLLDLHLVLVCDAACNQGKEPEKFFVSAGFALTHASSVTDVTAIEAVRVDEIDGDAVRAPSI